MNFTKAALLSLAAFFSLSNVASHDSEALDTRELRGSGSGSGRGRGRGARDLTLRVTNLSYRQPFSPFFYMTHSCDVSLYELGEEASEAMEELAEDGTSGGLLETYPATRPDVCMSAVTGGGIPPGESRNINVRTSRECPCVSIASMAIATNDCFVSVNGERLQRGMVNFYPGLDSGTEQNTEDCEEIPGCGDPMTNDNPDGMEEGFVHVHRGIEQRMDLDGTYQWLNPMMRVQVM